MPAMLTAAALSTLTAPTTCPECHEPPAGLVVTCERCHVPIHARCYADAVLTAPELAAFQVSDDVIPLLCRHCRS